MGPTERIMGRRFFEGCCMGFGGDGSVAIDASQLRVFQPADSGRWGLEHTTEHSSLVSKENDTVRSLVIQEVGSLAGSLATSEGTECTELEFLETGDGTVRVRGFVDDVIVPVPVLERETAKVEHRAVDWVLTSPVAEVEHTLALTQRSKCLVCCVDVTRVDTIVDMECCRTKICTVCLENILSNGCDSCPQCGEDLYALDMCAGLVSNLQCNDRDKDLTGARHGLVDSTLEAETAATTGATARVSPREAVDEDTESTEKVQGPQGCCFRASSACAYALKRMPLGDRCRALARLRKGPHLRSQLSVGRAAAKPSGSAASGLVVAPTTAASPRLA